MFQARRDYQNNGTIIEVFLADDLFSTQLPGAITKEVIAALSLSFLNNSELIGDVMMKIDVDQIAKDVSKKIADALAEQKLKEMKVEENKEAPKV